MLQTHCACQAKAAAAAAATAAASASNMTLSNVTAMPSTNLPPSGMGPFVHFVPYSEYVFFEWWNATTPALFWITFVLLLLLAIGYEMLVYYRTKLEKSVASRLQKKDYAGRANDVQVRFAFNVLLSAIYGFQVFYAYFLMMVFMTFNGYIIIAIIVGFFIGHLVVKCIKEPGIEPFQAETPCH